MITDILPKPSKVTIQGKEYTIGELSFDDIATLQSWVKDRVPHPLQAIREHLEGLRPEERKLLLEMAYADAGEWPPRYNSPQAQAVLQSADGVVFQLGLILGKGQAVTEDECKELARKMTPDEFKTVFGTACNLTPEDEIEGESSDPKE